MSARSQCDHFGWFVAHYSDASKLAVGTNREASSATRIGGHELSNATAASSAAYVFAWTGALRSQVAHVEASTTGFGDVFGKCLAISAEGSTLAVGSSADDSGATGMDGN